MERLESKSLQGDIVAQVGEAILDGSLEDGLELTQVGLANELGVSRMPVREALFALEHQGLLTRLPNNHCRVVRPTSAQIMRDLAMCEVLEADVLRAVPQDAELPIGERDFHLAVREACGAGYPRRVLVTTVDVYVSYLARIDIEGASARAVALAKTRAAHAAGDHDAAVAALHEYFSLLLAASPFEGE